MHGGRREGAGRKKGQAVKSVQQRREAIATMAKRLEVALPNAFEGEAHELLMAVYKDQDLPLPIRLDAAKAAIGYEKPKLAAVEHSGNQENPLSFNITSGVPRENEEPEHVNGHSGASH